MYIMWLHNIDLSVLLLNSHYFNLSSSQMFIFILKKLKETTVFTQMSFRFRVQGSAS